MDVGVGEADGPVQNHGGLRRGDGMGRSEGGAAVGGIAGDGHKDRAGGALAGIVAHARDLGIRIGVVFADAQALQQLLKTHSEDLLCIN